MRNIMKEKLTKIKAKDVIAIFKFIIAYPISIIYRIKRKNLWLICESGFEARDNGYWLFKYIRENHTLNDVVYVIDNSSPDFPKIEKLGEYIKQGSLKHWIYYLTATANISTHKGGKPNAAVCYVLEVILKMSNNRIFLQHGITLSDAKWLYYKNTNMDMFVCAAEKEYEFIKENFGYPENNVKLLGFSRFDTLKDRSHDNRSILIMPSWRNWLVKNADRLEVSKFEIEQFMNSDYFIKWSEFLYSKNVRKICRKYDVKLKFFPHRNIQPFIGLFNDEEHLEICSWEKYDIQDELRNSNLLVTDFSSVSLDFSYMNKPVIYYQFDVEEFRNNQYQEGYFSYENDGFGRVVYSLNDLEEELQNSIMRNFVNEKKYNDRIDKFFGHRYTNVSEMIYNEIETFVKERH